MDLFGARRLLALEAVLRSERWSTAAAKAKPGVEPTQPDGSLAQEPDEDYEVRRVLREFSRRFRVPLDRVYELDLGFVLTHYFESVYEEVAQRQVDEKDADQRPWLDRARDEAAESAAERMARLRQEASDEDEFLRRERELAQRQPKVVTPPRPAAQIQPAPREMAEARLPGPELLSDVNLKPGPKLPEGLSICVVDEE